MPDPPAKGSGSVPDERRFTRRRGDAEKETRGEFIYISLLRDLSSASPRLRVSASPRETPFEPKLTMTGKLPVDRPPGRQRSEAALRALRGTDELAEHEGQDAAVHVVVDLDGGVDANRERDFLRGPVLVD